MSAATEHRQSTAASRRSSSVAAAAAAASHRSAATSPTDAPHYSQPTQSDMELLDFLTSMPSSFPHAGPSSPSPPPTPIVAGKKRPLATLSALRRPPIDPIILAASLSSGPHVTRHHFHHSYGDKTKPHASGQMPASLRREMQAKAAEQAPLTERQREVPFSRQGRSNSTATSYANCDLEDDGGLEDLVDALDQAALSSASPYPSKQAPRSVRLQQEAKEKEAREEAARRQTEADRDARLKQAHVAEVARASEIRASDEGISSGKVPLQPAVNHEPPHRSDETASLLKEALTQRQAIAAAPVVSALPPTPGGFTTQPPPELSVGPSTTPGPPPPLTRLSSIVRPPPLQVRCYARTRIPTPHGEIFCHLYKNNHDAKEHMALVVDPMQNEPDVSIDKLENPVGPTPLRSHTLDEVWGPEETEMERIVRGAYVGRLGPTCQVASQPRHGQREHAEHGSHAANSWEPPLVRIHSECYTGETIGSQRCDCGEQLDEALRLILHSGTGVEPSGASAGRKRPRLPRGVVVYMRQEGRGIGLLDKLMAYNLQDMGHDTVSANVLLGHLPDARRYNIASAILQDLGISECRLLTNNPEKMEALEAEGIPVKERVAMVPRAWLEDARREERSHKRRTKQSRRRQKTDPVSLARQERRSRRHQREQSDQSQRPSKARARLPRVAALATPQSDLSRSILSQAPSDVEDDISGGSISHQLGRMHQGSDLESQASDYGESDSTGSIDSEEDDDDDDEYRQHLLRSGGATMIGSSATRSVELERYLRTKIEKMGHLLDMPTAQRQPSKPASGDEAAGRRHRKSALANTLSNSKLEDADASYDDEAAEAGHATGTDPESLLDEQELRRIANGDHIVAGVDKPE
ncbi:unnamed protein product [Parajaminaea phylloscopi]